MPIVGDIVRVTMFRGHALTEPMWVLVLGTDGRTSDYPDRFDGRMMWGPQVDNPACRYGGKTGFSRGGAPDHWDELDQTNLPDEYLVGQAKLALVTRSNRND